MVTPSGSVRGSIDAALWSTGPEKKLFTTAPVDFDEGGHLLQSDRGHHSNLMAAS